MKAKTYKVCQTCRKPKPKPPTTRYVSRLEYERDPYCSRTCAELAYGTKTVSTPTTS